MTERRRRRSRDVALVAVPILALAFAACGGDEETAYCVDENDQIVENRYCEDDEARGGGAFFWYYGGTLAGRAVRWLRGKDALVPAKERHARDAREERRFHFARVVTMVPVLLFLTAGLAVVIWVLAADASLLAVLARHAGLAVLLGLLAPSALRATDELF